VSATKTNGGEGLETRPWLFDLSFSAYFSLLYVWFEESKPFAWPTRYLRFWHPHAVALRRSDFLAFYLEVLIILTAAIFLGVRLISRFTLTRKLVRATGGILAFAGFPLVCLYGEKRLLLVAALAVAGVCFVLWARLSWFRSTALNVLLLSAYYAFCWFVAGKAPLEDRPIEGWTIGDYVWILYPVVGFLYSLVWAAYFRQAQAESVS
jgi:hypothetical protein